MLLFLRHPPGLMLAIRKHKRKKDIRKLTISSLVLFRAEGLPRLDGCRRPLPGIGERGRNSRPISLSRGTELNSLREVDL